MITTRVYKGRDNRISLGLKADGAFVDVSALSRMTLQVGELTVDSRIHANAFDWTSNGSYGQVDIDIA